jgi:NADH dehydrogenase
MPSPSASARQEQIDLAARKVITSRHLDGARNELEYDHLVFALGSAEHLELYPGLAEHPFRLKTFPDCFRLKNHILEMFELADIETDPEERRRLLTFFVAGGGYAGTEIAGELADFVRLLTSKEYPGIRRDECRVVLVHRGDKILPELYGSGSTEGQGRGKGGDLPDGWLALRVIPSPRNRRGPRSFHLPENAV